MQVDVKDRGLVDLARLAVEDVVRLVPQEIELAKREVKEMVASNVRAAIFLGLAAVCSLFAINMVLVTIALLFGAHAALVAAIEAVVLLVVTAICALLGKSRLRIGPPEQMVSTLKEDAEWAKQLLKPDGK